MWKLQVHEVAEGIMAWVLGPSIGDANPHPDPAPAAGDPTRLAAAAAALLRSFEGLSPLEGRPNPGQTAAAPSPGAAEAEPGELLTATAAAAGAAAAGAESSQVMREAAGHGVPLAAPAPTDSTGSRAAGAARGGTAPRERGGAAVGDMREAHLACLVWLRALLQRRRPTDAAEQVQAALLAALLAAPQARTPPARLPAMRLRLQGVGACGTLAVLLARMLMHCSRYF